MNKANNIDRLMGSESELAINLFANDEEQGVKTIVNLVINNLDLRITVFENNNIDADYYLSTGGRIYPDSELLETCSPESLGPEEATYTEMVSKRIVLDALSRLCQDKSYKFDLFDRVIDQQSNTWGYHNNYLIEREHYDPGNESIEKDLFINLMSSHFLSRVIFNGGGLVKKNSGSKKDYHVLAGQKLQTVSTYFENDTVVDKPLFNIRDKSLANSNNWARLHDVSGDSNISPWATWWNKGSTSLLIRLYENHKNKEYKIPYIEDPVKAALSFAKDPSLPFYVNKQQKYSALDIQECLYNQCAALAVQTELPPSELKVLDEWQKAITDYKKNPYLLSNRVDWILKKELIERKNLNFRKAQILDLEFGRLGSKLTELIQKRNVFPGFDPNKLTSYYSPPTQTRAFERVCQLINISSEEEKITSINWILYIRNFIFFIFMIFIKSYKK